MRVSDRKSLLKSRRDIAFYGTLVVITSLVIFLLFLKTSSKRYFELTAFTMGTRLRVVISSSKMNPGSLAKLVVDEFKRIDSKFDPYDPRSVIYKVNHSDGWVVVDEETFVVIEAAVDYAKLTNGAFDPTLGRLIELWGFNDMEKDPPKKPPSPDEIEEALKKCGYENVKLAKDRMAVKLENGVWLDLGGMVKGYALDRAYTIVKSVDPDATGFIDAGGDIRIIGPKYGKFPWTIGIRDPFNSPSDAIDFVYLKEGAIATSGDYERYFIYDGKRYHHILDPKTGYPARGVRSVTVIADEAVKADVLSTAGFVMGKGWRYVVLKFPEFGAHVLMVMEDGTIRKDHAFAFYEEKR